VGAAAEAADLRRVVAALDAERDSLQVRAGLTRSLTPIIFSGWALRGWLTVWPCEDRLRT
jgi:hypothetical protein